MSTTDPIRALLVRARQKFQDYEMDVGEPAPYEHRRLMDEIDTALSQPPEPAEGPSDDDLRIAFIEGAGFWLHGDALTPGLRAVADLFTPRPAPIAVAERPWERDGWCDDEGRFWAGWINENSSVAMAGWTLCRANELDDGDTHALPHNALPVLEVQS